MVDYIKRTDVMKICENYSEHCFNSSDAKGQDIADRILDDVVKISTADVEVVKRGQWERHECSMCGHYALFANDYNFCPNCGAKMDGRSDA